MKRLFINNSLWDVLKETKTLYYTQLGRFRKDDLTGFGNDYKAKILSEEEEQQFLLLKKTTHRKNEMVYAIYDNISRGAILYKKEIEDIKIIYDQLVKMGIIKNERNKTKKKDFN